MILTTLDAESMQLQQYVGSVGKVSLPNFIRITNEEGFEMPKAVEGRPLLGRLPSFLSTLFFFFFSY